jgi:DNA replication protein DnaC
MKKQTTNQISTQMKTNATTSHSNEFQKTLDVSTSKKVLSLDSSSPKKVLPLDSQNPDSLNLASSSPASSSLKTCYTITDNYRQFNFSKCLRYLTNLGRKKYGSTFTVHAEDRDVLHKLISYAISSEEQCKEHGLDLQKGILLTGSVGCGKTTLMTLLPEFMYPFQKYTVKNTREIAAQYHKEGYEIIHSLGRRKKPICLDDLGVEQNIKHFGNDCNTVGEILLHRYDMHVNYNIITHATTNLNADELEKIYGNRVRSRLREMFNLISFPESCKDKRK